MAAMGPLLLGFLLAQAGRRLALLPWLLRIECQSLRRGILFPRSAGHLLCLGFDGQHVASGVVAFLAAWVLASGLPP